MTRREKTQARLNAAKAALETIDAGNVPAEPESLPLIADAQDIVRAHPAACLGASAVTGLVLARYPWARQALKRCVKLAGRTL